MRPVTRTGNWNYPATIQILSAVPLAAIGANGLFPVAGTGNTFTTFQVIGVMANLVALNGGKDKWANLPNAGDRALMVYLIDNVFNKGKNSGFGNARMALVQSLGQYCSYCGMPVNDTSLAVEHMLPKASFPDIMMCYPNFLLACTPCNSLNKIDHPTAAEASSWAGAGANYQAIKNAGLDHYVWPVDNTSYSGDSYSGFAISLYEYGDPTAIPENIAVNQKNYWTSNTNNEVTATLYNSATGQYTSHKVYIKYDGAGASANLANNMIALVGLNNTKPGNLKVTDRRMVNRTVAMFEALAGFDRLQRCYNDTGDHKLYDMLVRQFLTTARYSGFYEVLIAVIYSLCANSQIGGFYNSFKQQTCNSNIPSVYFPGTDPTRLP